MKTYKFLDLQVGGYASHTTIKGLAEMLVEDYNDIVAEDHTEMLYLEGMNEQQMRDLIESYDYEIIEEEIDKKHQKNA